ncbi:hypothetical protein WG902_13980 [Ramlibacter sp. PS3R-8]|uniref:hypothetical protein n=1 Tax=Ramlibacter sp. PS3R-8 TaxID=3133437 RepID=UPI0030AD8067
MTDMQPAQSAATPVMMDLSSSTSDDFDYALGCECADPSLQIEQWQQLSRASSAE